MKFAKPWYRKSRRAWFVTLNGKQVKLGVTKQEALDAYHKMMVDPPPAPAEEPSEAPKEYVVGIIQRFMRHVRAELAPDTIEWYRYRLQRFVDHLISQKLDGMTVGELRPYHVREWVNSHEHLAPGSKRNLIRAVQRCFNWAVEDHLISFSPVAAMKKPKAGKREMVVSQAEFKELLSFVRDQSLADLLEVTFDSGCRPQESLEVTAAHVDLTNSRWVLQQSEGKPGDMRVVYLPDKSLEITRRLMLKHPGGPLFRNSRGASWTTDAVNCAFTRLRIRMGQRILEQQVEDRPADRRRKYVAVKDEDVEKKMKTLNPFRTSGEAKTIAELRHEARRKLTYLEASKSAPK